MSNEYGTPPTHLSLLRDKNYYLTHVFMAGTCQPVPTSLTAGQKRCPG